MSIQISITGDLASGKSTLTHHLADTLNLEQIQVGDLVRNLAQKQKIDILQANSRAKSAFMDEQVDSAVALKIKEVEAAGRDYIIDARVGFHYAPNSLKIKLITHPDIAAERALKADRKSEGYETFDEAYASLQQRRTLEKDRFIKRYNVDVDDFSNFDLVIDTSFIQKHDTAEIVEMVLKARKEGKPFPQFWCHPGQLIPSGQSHRDFKTDMARELITDMLNNQYDHLASSAGGLSALTVDRTHQGDLLLYDGHHRTVAANVASLPYIGFSLRSQNAEYTLKLLTYMYDNYTAMEYLATELVEKNPSHIPFWGQENLNDFKLGFVQRFVAWRDNLQPGISLDAK